MVILNEQRGRLITYEDGNILFIPDSLDNLNKILDGTSQTTKQRLLVIVKMKKDKKQYNASVIEVANELKVEPSTVYDKLQRKLGCSSEEIQKIINDSIFSNDFTFLRDLLIDNVKPKKKREEDIKAIKEIFKLL